MVTDQRFGVYDMARCEPARACLSLGRTPERSVRFSCRTPGLSRPPIPPRTYASPDPETAPPGAFRAPACPTGWAFPDSVQLPPASVRSCEIAPFAAARGRLFEPESSGPQPIRGRHSLAAPRLRQKLWLNQSKCSHFPEINGVKLGQGGLVLSAYPTIYHCDPHPMAKVKGV